MTQAAAALRAGKLVLLPTDTVYGLCGDPANAAAADAAYALKGRLRAQPFAVVARDVDALLECVPELAGPGEAIARALLPGPYTLVLPNPARRFRWLTGANPDTIGVRVPRLADAVAEVLGEVGCAFATSANRTGERDPARLDDVPAEIRAACAAEVDTGPLPGVPSTVIDLVRGAPRVLREGAVPAAEALARAEAALRRHPRPRSSTRSK